VPSSWCAGSRTIWISAAGAVVFELWGDTHFFRPRYNFILIDFQTSACSWLFKLHFRRIPTLSSGHWNANGILLLLRTQWPFQSSTSGLCRYLLTCSHSCIARAIVASNQIPIHRSRRTGSKASSIKMCIVCVSVSVAIRALRSWLFDIGRDRDWKKSSFFSFFPGFSGFL
jgi:hypothetical protein